mgnify:FL=1
MCGVCGVVCVRSDDCFLFSEVHTTAVSAVCDDGLIGEVRKWTLVGGNGNGDGKEGR